MWPIFGFCWFYATQANTPLPVISSVNESIEMSTFPASGLDMENHSEALFGMMQPRPVTMQDLAFPPIFEVALLLPVGSIDFVYIASILLKAGYTSGLSPINAWTLLGGPALMRDRLNVLSGQSSSKQSMDNTLQALFFLATNLAASTEKDEFEAQIGLANLCEQVGKYIKASHFKWSNVPLSFVGQLPKYCIIKDRELVRISFLHRVRPRSRSMLVLYVRRSFVFADSIDALLSLYTWASIDIHFTNEAGVGDGVTRDWFSEMAAQIFTDPTLFTQGASHPYLKKSLTIDAKLQRKLKAIGRFLGQSIYHEMPLGMVLPVHYWAHIIRQNLTLADIEEEEPILFRSYKEILEAENVDILDLQWERDGTPVTLENRQTYIDQLLQDRLLPYESELLGYLQEGFLDFVPIGTITGYLTPKQIVDVVAGSATVDLADLLTHANLDGYRRDSPEIIGLVSIMSQWKTEMRLKFLRFVTGRTRLPFGGFGALHPAILIRRVPGANGIYPYTQTCYHILNLPSYGSVETMRNHLELAVTSEMILANQ